nr:type V CRISPR-associated protein Cas12b [Alicyclobacillus shizuokensis]
MYSRRAGEKYARLLEQKSKLEQVHVAERPHLVQLARALEADMQAAGQEFAAKRGRGAWLTERALRGADRVFAQWMWLPKDAPFAQYEAVIRQAQAERRGTFGSYDLFASLAEPRYQPLWREDPTFLRCYALYSSVLRKLQQAERVLSFRLPDPCVDPVWTRFEHGDGTNLHKYELVFDHFGPGRHAVRFQRMLVEQDGVAQETESVLVPVAPSAQLDKLRPRRDGQSRIALWFTDAGQPAGFPAQWIGATLQYARKALARAARRGQERRGPGPSAERLVGASPTAQEAGDAYLNIRVHVQSPSQVRGRRLPPYAAVFRVDDHHLRVKVQAGKLAAYLQEHPDDRILGAPGLLSGLRVMSVDTGLGTSASASVFRVAERTEVESAEGRSLHYYAIHGTLDWVAVHERSLRIRMPGETHSRRLRELREHRAAALRSLRVQLGVLWLLLRCRASDERIRARSWRRLLDAKRESAHGLTSSWREALETELAQLQAHHGQVPDPDWTCLVDKAVTTLWRHMSQQVRAWRKQVRSGDKPKVKGYRRDVVGGNSRAQIAYLEQQYRFLRGWTLFSQASGRVAQVQREARFAASLREHIENAKRDRLKKWADRVLMEALGYVYESDGGKKRRWVAKHPPCQLIVLEEPSARRFPHGRPRRDSGSAMGWEQRELLAELTSQARVHDVLVGTVSAAFMSRFDARTGAPGVSCRRVPARLAGEAADSLPPWLTEFLARHQLDSGLLRADDVIPTGDGEFLVSPCADGHFRQVHAGVNAAQNLQRRLWKSIDIGELRLHGEVKTDGVVAAQASRASNQSREAAHGHRVLVSKDGVTFFSTRRVDDVLWPYVFEYLSAEGMELLTEADDSRAGAIVLFRDPSGQINKGLWTRQDEFWSQVGQRVESYAVTTIRRRAARR